MKRILRQSVLVVDSDEHTANVVNATFNEDLYDVVFEPSLFRALESLQIRIFDIAIINISKSDLQTVELVKKIRTYQKLQDLELILISNDKSEEFNKDLEHVGYYEFIQKPIKSKDILDAIDYMESQKKESLVIVDNDPAYLHFACEIFENAYNVVSFLSASEALEYLKEATPDALLLDVGVKDIECFSFYETVHTMPHLKRLPVVFFTSENSDANELRIIQDSGNDFLKKPIQPEVALYRIQKVLDIKNLQQKLDRDLQKQTREFYETKKIIKDLSTQLKINSENNKSPKHFLKRYINAFRRYIETIMSVLLVLIAIVVFMLFSYEKSERNSKLFDSENYINNIAKTLNSTIQQNIDVLTVTAELADFMVIKKYPSDKLHELLVTESSIYEKKINEDFNGIFGIFNGVYLDGSNWVPPADWVIEDRPWFIDAKNAYGETVLGEPYIDLQTGEVIVTVSKELSDKKSVIALDVKLNKILDILQSDFDDHSIDYGIILNKEGVVVANSKASNQGKNLMSDNATSTEKTLAQIALNSNNNYVEIELDGDKYFVFTAKTMNNWTVINVAKKSVYLSSVRKNLYINIFLALIIFVLVMYFCTVSYLNDRHASKLSFQVVNTLASTIDAKDKYTKGHSVRVTKYAYEIGKRLKFSKHKLQELKFAALLHDLGKIGIPDSIINKAGRLTEFEYETIKTHPVIGAEILKNVDEMAVLEVGAKYHHERFDGKGYPEGLSGTNIPEFGRIIAVADAYDAMTSNRSYRSVIPQAIVRKEIESGMGKQFDPKMAKIMLNMIDEDKNYDMRDHSAPNISE